MSSTYVKQPELKRFISDCLKKVGVNVQHANISAEVLAYFNIIGIENRGLGDLTRIIQEIKKGIINPNAVPRILKELDSTVWVTGNDGLGFVVGNFCMQIAIKKAKKTGLCIVSTTNSNNFGCAAYYAELASNADLIGLVCTNTSCNVIVPRGTKSGTGSNPIAFSAPGKDNERLSLDMACTTISEAKLRSVKGEFSKYWALDINRRPATKFETFAFLQHLGTSQATDHKGYGLTLMVDVLSGLFSGSNYGPYIPRRNTRTSPPNIGHCFIVLNPGCFAPGFAARMADIMRSLRQIEPLKPGIPVIVPGDKKKSQIKEMNDQGGIKLSEDLIRMSNFLSTTLKVKSLTTFKK
ncbi:hypothetical protein L9F63_011884 [Diploptera punctata]|uniref:Malate dehydrogenase n=1 Tax=Diploptera punctata TaxID=6984 RepID=A0AAD8AGA9_DIPPU|nr:hypothetical protein L9F63_011884 [Diploptera punctata]